MLKNTPLLSVEEIGRILAIASRRTKDFKTTPKDKKDIFQKVQDGATYLTSAYLNWFKEIEKYGRIDVGVAEKNPLALCLMEFLGSMESLSRMPLKDQRERGFVPSDWTSTEERELLNQFWKLSVCELCKNHKLKV